MSAENRIDIDDVLTEDPPIRNQKYFVLSYVLPEDNKGAKFPLFKMRGAYSSIEECEARVKKLQISDKYFNMYICEVGLFGTLYPMSEIEKNEDIDKKYREKELNQMVAEYKKNKDAQDVEFENRKQFLAKKAQEDGTPEGQARLAEAQEDPVSIKNRIEKLTLQKDELLQKLKIVDSVLERDAKTLEEVEKN